MTLTLAPLDYRPRHAARPYLDHRSPRDARRVTFDTGAGRMTGLVVRTYSDAYGVSVGGNVHRVPFASLEELAPVAPYLARYSPACPTR